MHFWPPERRTLGRFLHGAKMPIISSRWTIPFAATVLVADENGQWLTNSKSWRSLQRARICCLEKAAMAQFSGEKIDDRSEAYQWAAPLQIRFEPPERLRSELEKTRSATYAFAFAKLVYEIPNSPGSRMRVDGLGGGFGI